MELESHSRRDVLPCRRQDGTAAILQLISDAHLPGVVLRPLDDPAGERITRCLSTACSHTCVISPSRERSACWPFSPTLNAKSCTTV